MDTVIQQNATPVQQAAPSSQSMQEASALEKLVSIFHLNEGGGGIGSGGTVPLALTHR